MYLCKETAAVHTALPSVLPYFEAKMDKWGTSVCKQELLVVSGFSVLFC